MCNFQLSPVPCMWSLANSNSLMCWLVIGLKEPQASKISGIRWEAIVVYLSYITVKESLRNVEERNTFMEIRHYSNHSNMT